MLPPLALAALAAVVIVAAFVLLRKKKCSDTPVEIMGNNGSAPCSVFCAANWGNQLPSCWTGASAVSQRLVPGAGDVATDAKFQSTTDATALINDAGAPVACTCGPSTSPFLTGVQVPAPWAHYKDNTIPKCGSPADPTVCGAQCPIPGLCP